MNTAELEQKIKELESELCRIKSETPNSTSSLNTLPSLLVDNFPGFISCINIDTLQYEYINAYYEKMLRISRYKIIGSHVKDIRGANVFQIALKYIEKVKTEKKTITFEEELSLGTGKQWYHGEFSPVYENGKLVRIAVLCYEISNIKKIEKAKVESDERFRQLFQQAPLGYQSLDINGNFIEVNERWLELLGYNREEVIGKWFGDFLSDDYKKIFEIRFPLFVTEGKVHAEFEMIHKNGSKLFISFEGRIGRDENNVFKQTHCIMQDITQRKILEESLIKSEEYFRSIFENNSTASCIVEPDTTISKANCRVCELTGYSIEEIIGSSWLKFISEDEIDRLYGYNQNWLSGNHDLPEKYELKFHKKDGETRKALISIVQLSNNKILASVVDITEIKQLQDELKRSEEYFRTIFENNSAAISIIEPDTTISMVNDRFAEMVGYTKDEICRTSWTKYVYHEDLESLKESFMRGIIKPPETKRTYEFRFVRKNGEVRHTLMNVSVLSSKKVISSYLDITDRKLLETELVKAKDKAQESDRLKTAFLANMSHEIRTPMNGILGFTELMKEPNLSAEEQLEFINTISKSGDRLFRTINAIVDISKIESGSDKPNIQKVDINEKLDFTYKFFKIDAEAKGLQFQLSKKLNIEESLVNTDNEKVYSILSNLVDNAIKFTENGYVDFGCERDNNFLRFHVKDTGIGIPDTHKTIIFERFRQGSESISRNYEGNGLGLSISRDYVEMLGGKIWFKSEINKGTTFYFTVPCSDNSEKKIKTINNLVMDENTIKNEKLKILIVEDDEISYSLLIAMLHEIDSLILHAATGPEAIQLCRENHDIDLILMDIRIPELNGNEVTRQIRQFNKDVIIIAQTAYGFSTDCETALAAGCNDFISKPLYKSKLIALINKYCFIKPNLDLHKYNQISSDNFSLQNDAN